MVAPKSEDVPVCARIALSTMPAERRPLVQVLLNPANDGKLMASTLETHLRVSRPTAHRRMELAETLGIATYSSDESDNRGPKCVTLNSRFKWPDSLAFPTF